MNIKEQEAKQDYEKIRCQLEKTRELVPDLVETSKIYKEFNSLISKREILKISLKDKFDMIGIDNNISKTEVISKLKNEENCL